ncbi:MAG: kelch repeat-containing protein [Candidatus Nitrosocosmicus sp.]|nr:kelch repeat-containing protein [Candidatus Nitrosocosmicus sp.]
MNNKFQNRGSTVPLYLILRKTAMMNLLSSAFLIIILCTALVVSIYSNNTLQYSFSQQGTSSFWTRGTDMPRVTTEATSTNLGDAIYVIGGYDEEGEGVGMVEMYNATSDTWAENIAQLPVPLHHTSAASDQGIIYVAGGYTGDWTASDRLFIYDPQTNQWTQGNPMPTPRGYPTADFVNGTLYVMGGDGGEGYDRALNATESYDPNTNQWTIHSSMPTPRHHAASAVVDGNIYVIGGRIAEELNNVDLIEKYDPVSDQWTTDLQPMPSKRSGIAATSVNGSIYVLGGEQNQGTFNNNERYDPATDTWSEELPMMNARHGLGVASYDDKIYAIGGGAERGFFTSGMNEIFHLSNDTNS